MMQDVKPACMQASLHWLQRHAVLLQEPQAHLFLAAGPDHELALDLYQRAAAMNDAEGLFSLAWMHARGLAVPANSTLARQLLDRALAAALQPSYKVGHF